MHFPVAPPALHLAAPPLPPLTGIPTKRGVFYVPWRLDCVQSLLRIEGLTAADLEADHRLFRPFLRRLFMLAAQEALSPQCGRQVRDLARHLRPRP